jgi:hypothetical protein
MKNKIFKTCLTSLALSVAGLAHAQTAVEPVTIFTEALMSHAVISGGALNIAADSVVDGNLAAQAAVTIGAGLNSQTQDIYAGAAVTTGALSTVKHIFSGAAAGIGASAHAQNVHAGAAITVGAGGDVQQVHAGAAITLGAGASTNSLPLDANAHTASAAVEDIHNATSMAAAIAQIGIAQAALTTLNDSITNTPESLYTTMGGFVSLAPGVHQGSALSIAANSMVDFTAPDDSTDDNHVWVINLTEALTVGAGTEFTTTNLTDGDTATIIWNVGAAVTLGAGTEFIGTAFVGGAFGAATSDVTCGNIYATGAVSVGSVGSLATGTDNFVACDTDATGLGDFVVVAGGDYLVNPVNPPENCPLWDAGQIASVADVIYFNEYDGNIDLFWDEVNEYGLQLNGDDGDRSISLGSSWGVGHYSAGQDITEGEFDACAASLRKALVDLGEIDPVI